MKVKLNISCDADKALRRLEGMSLRATNFKPLFWYARRELQRANAENFALGGLPSGKKWAERTRPYAWPLMIRTGKLMESLTNLFGPPNEVDRMDAVFGTKVEYAKFHQYGTTRMPSRKIVFEPRGFARDLATKAADYVVNARVP